jgi:isocitrate dehydrogenase
MDKVNPTAEILAAGLMLDFLGWREAANRLRDAIRKVIASKLITYDLARQMPEAKQVATSVFAQAVVDAIHGAPR